MHEGRISASHGLLASDVFFPGKQQNFIPKDSSQSGVFSQHSPPQILASPPPPNSHPTDSVLGAATGKKGSFELHLQGPREKERHPVWDFPGILGWMVKVYGSWQPATPTSNWPSLPRSDHGPLGPWTTLFRISFFLSIGNTFMWLKFPKDLKWSPLSSLVLTHILPCSLLKYTGSHFYPLFLSPLMQINANTWSFLPFISQKEACQSPCPALSCFHAF